jgi:hypothetical protein
MKHPVTGDFDTAVTEAGVNVTFKPTKSDSKQRHAQLHRRDTLLHRRQDHRSVTDSGKISVMSAIRGKAAK